MTIIEIQTTSDDLTGRQRWANVFTIIVAILSIGYGINLRQSALSERVEYRDTRAGIIAQYPQGWLLDTRGDYVFRVRDMAIGGYKTTIQIATIPISGDTTERNLADALTLERAQTLTDYRVLSIDVTTVGEQTANTFNYTYVDTESSPFLEGIPSVVVGTDYVVFSRGQAIVITFRADSNNFNDVEPIFDQFLNELEF